MNGTASLIPPFLVGYIFLNAKYSTDGTGNEHLACFNQSVASSYVKFLQVILFILLRDEYVFDIYIWMMVSIII